MPEPVPSTPLASIDYRSTYGRTSLIVLATGVGVMILSRVLPASEFRGWFTADVAALFGAALALVSVHNFFRARAFNANGHTIRLFADRVEFNRARGYRGEIQVLRFADIRRVEVATGGEGGGSVKVDAPQLSHRFDADDVHPRDALFDVWLAALKLRAQDAEFVER